MKKIIAAFLCALLAVSGVALAEPVKLMDSTSRFDVTLSLPEGAELTLNELQSDYSVAKAAFGDLAPVGILIAPSEEYAEMSLADLSDEEVNKMLADTAIDFDEPASAIDVTPSGNKYIIVRQDGTQSMATIITIYRGYFVQLVQFFDEYEPLTEADTEFLMNVLYGIEFVDVAK
ncbi:MAG: hypothetical protein PHI27_11835 [Eubacteriales bacterium]|nr:hypothetical protein [Eubacteriales bacterium]MDD3882920.1 hypothetical protein [Eubacteriales bacterium]MDD4513910.1 hypothetical protein [Eubacteriales bacterium]